MKKIVERLSCTLTQEEFETKSRELAVTCQEIGSAHYNAKCAAKEFKDKITKLEERRSDLARAIRDRAEFREVECQENINHLARQAITIRLDTGEEVGRRALLLDELQEEMDLHASVSELSLKVSRKRAEA